MIAMPIDCDSAIGQCNTLHIHYPSPCPGQVAVEAFGTPTCSPPRFVSDSTARPPTVRSCRPTEIVNCGTAVAMVFLMPQPIGWSGFLVGECTQSFTDNFSFFPRLRRHPQGKGPLGIPKVVP